MKTNFTKNVIRSVVFFSLVVSRSLAQSTSIDIGSARQNIDPLNTFNAWTVVTESPDMHHSLCFSDSYSAGPAPFASTVSPVNIGQNALVINTFPQWPDGTYLSCYPYNTIYTPDPLRTTWTCCYMVIRRKFYVVSDVDEQVNFNLTLTVDDYVNKVIVDAATAPNTIYTTNILTSSLTAPVTISAILNLSPGMHTIDIQCNDWESEQGGYGSAYYIVNGAPRQWNPFGVSIQGSLSSRDNVLLNTNPTETTGRLTGTTLNIGPSPFTNNTKAMFSIAGFKGNTTLQILDINNNLIKSFHIKNATGQIDLGNIQTPSGPLIVNIVSGGRILVSKKSIKF